jgi:hypothetical protein
MTTLLNAGPTAGMGNAMRQARLARLVMTLIEGIFLRNDRCVPLLTCGK